MNDYTDYIFLLLTRPELVVWGILPASLHLSMTDMTEVHQRYSITGQHNWPDGDGEDHKRIW